MKLMIEQLAELAKNSNSNPSPLFIELGRYTIELWYIQCRQSRHSAQFCNSMLSQNHLHLHLSHTIDLLIDLNTKNIRMVLKVISLRN